MNDLKNSIYIFSIIISLPIGAHAPIEHSEWPSKEVLLKEAQEIHKKKRDVVVAVIDSGANYISFLKDNFYLPTTQNEEIKRSNYGLDFTENDKIFSFLYDPYNYLPEDDDKNSHGTHGATLITTVNPEVKLLILKYTTGELDESNSKKKENYLEAFQYAIDQDVDIINFSTTLYLKDMELFNLLKQAKDKDILVVTPSGNGNFLFDGIDVDSSCRVYPTCFGLENVITVGSYKGNYEFIKSANYGVKSIEITAPGDHVLGFDKYGLHFELTGTSQSAFIVSGALALFLSEYEKGEIDALEVKELLLKSKGVGEKNYKENEIHTRAKALNIFQFLKIGQEYLARGPNSLKKKQSTK